MSRWVEQYNIHPFHTSWNQFEQIIDTVDEKKITDANALIEIARIKKVITYIESYLKIIDPELVQINYLQEAANNLAPCISEINNFISNNVIGHLHNTNSYLDSCVVSIKQLNPIIPKINGRSISSMVDAYNHAITNGLEQVDFQAVQIASKSIEDLKSKLIDDDDSIESQIDAMHEESSSKYQKINEFYNETLIDATGQESTKTAIEEAKKDILRDTKEASDKLTETSSKIEKLDEFYIKIFGELDEKKVRVGGLKAELDKRIKTLDDFEKMQQDKHVKILQDKLDEIKQYEKDQQLHNKNLFNQIETLLPTATNAGLAKAYHDERERFAKPLIFWNRVFIVALSVMFIATFISFISIIHTQGHFELHFAELKTFDQTINNLLYKLPLYGPLIWLAIYASKRRSENQRLEQEYAHKEALAMSYSSYKKQIEELKQTDQELLIKLLNSTINTISENASKTLDGKHGDGTPLKEVLEQVLEIKRSLFKGGNS